MNDLSNYKFPNNLLKSIKIKVVGAQFGAKKNNDEKFNNIWYSPGSD